jgi:DNA-binding LacI/PurR family transcriptional regulator
MADAAVEMLLERLGGGRKRRKRQVFDFEFRHRGSCCNQEAVVKAR